VADERVGERLVSDANPHSNPNLRAAVITTNNRTLAVAAATDTNLSSAL